MYLGKTLHIVKVFVEMEKEMIENNVMILIQEMGMDVVQTVRFRKVITVMGHLL